MKRIRWTQPAAQDLYNITRYIGRDNPEAARQVERERGSCFFQPCRT
jgi:plasmid stabilization system protein ParE